MLEIAGGVILGLLGWLVLCVTAVIFAAVAVFYRKRRTLTREAARQRQNEFDASRKKAGGRIF